MPKKSGYDDLPLNIHLNGNKRKDNITSLRKIKSFRKSTAKSTAKNRGPIRGASAPATRTKTSLAFRRVVVKARVIKMTSYGVGAAKLHLRYLDREGTSKNKEKEGFYDREETGLSRKEISAVKDGEPHQFRFIVSPEDAEQLNLTDYTRSFMHQIENDLGRELDWKAVNHYNTDNLHTHVVVHGLDKKGQALYIDKEYISNGMRNRASEVATRELGQRLEHEIKASLQKEIKAKALTRLDYQLVRQSNNQTVDIPLYKNSPAARLQRSTMLGRLTELERMGLAEKQNNNRWNLAENLEGKLRDLQKNSEIEEQLKVAESRLNYPASGYRKFDAKSTEKIQGIVIDKGIRDELSDNGYLVLGDHQGNLNYVEVGRLNQYDNISIDSTVGIKNEKSNWVTHADLNISKYSMGNSGKVDLDKYGKWAVSQGKVSHEKLSDFVQTHQKRLQTLQRYGLAHQSNNVWNVSDTLLEQLEKKSFIPKTTIRKLHQLSITEQIQYQGRTYLDNHYHDFAENNAPNGVTQKLQEAAQLRAKWLQKQGLDAGTQNSRNALDEMERKALADGISERTGLSFKPLLQGKSLEGKHVGVIATKSVRRYAVVANAKEFSMIPWRQPHIPNKGQQMAIGVNQQDRAWSKQIQRGIER